MYMFANLYFETTSPESPYKRLLEFDVIFSILLHAVFYTFALCIFGYVFNVKFSKKTYMKLFLILLLIMTIGYPARLARVKDMKRTLIGYGFTISKNLNKIKEMIIKIKKLNLLSDTKKRLDSVNPCPTNSSITISSASFF